MNDFGQQLEGKAELKYQQQSLKFRDRRGQTNTHEKAGKGLGKMFQERRPQTPS
jgi:hypothetical protein